MGLDSFMTLQKQTMTQMSLWWQICFLYTNEGLNYRISMYYDSLSPPQNALLSEWWVKHSVQKLWPPLMKFVIFDIFLKTIPTGQSLLRIVSTIMSKIDNQDDRKCQKGEVVSSCSAPMRSNCAKRKEGSCRGHIPWTIGLQVWVLNGLRKKSTTPSWLFWKINSKS